VVAGLMGHSFYPARIKLSLRVDDKEVATNSFTVQGDPEIQNLC